MPRSVPLLAAAVLLFIILPAQAGTLAHDLQSDLNSPELAGAVVGIEVAYAKTGKILFQQNAATRLMPASNRKLFTSAAALSLLGDDYRLKTLVLAGAKPDSAGQITGDLYLKGGGDSLLSAADLADLAKVLAAQGVKSVADGVVGDGSYFTGNAYGEGWEVGYLSEYFAPQVSGLEACEDVVAVHVAGGAKTGDAAVVTIDPQTAFVPLALSCQTTDANTPPALDISRAYDQSLVRVAGHVPVGYHADKPNGLVTVPNPPLFAATLFKEALVHQGIDVKGEPKVGSAPAGGFTLAEHDSVPIAQYIGLMNKPSDNLLAESLVRVLGAEKGQGGSFDNGHAVEEGFFEKNVGVAPGDLHLADGSGLSRRNLVTARAEVALLEYMARQPDFKAYYDSLPVAGVDGTLEKRMIGTLAAGNVHAKTGYVTGCRALAGYVIDRSGRMLAFSMLMNNYVVPTAQINQIQDAIVARLAQEK